MCILSTRMDSSAAGVRYFPIRDPPDNSPNRVYPGTVLGIPSGILRTTAPSMSILGLSSGSHQGSSGQQPQPCLSWDCPVDPIRDPPDNSPNRVYPGTVLGIPSGILWTTAPSMSILGLPWGSHQGSSGQQPQACLSWDCPGDPIRDPPDNSPKHVYPGTALGIPSGILRTTAPSMDCPVDPIRDPPDNSPKHVYPGTVQWIPSGILRTTAPSMSILGLSCGSHQGSSGQQPQPCLSWDCLVDPIRDPPDNSPNRVYPGTALGISIPCIGNPRHSSTYATSS